MLAPFCASKLDLGARIGLGSHFGDFLEVSRISKNVCFIIVKLYFSRFGRVLVCDFFALCFCIDTFKIFYWNFADLLVLKISMGSQMGPFWGPSESKLTQNLTLWGHHGSKVAPRPEKGSIWGHFGVTLGCF